jgi:hypothetical protein
MITLRKLIFILAIGLFGCVIPNPHGHKPVDAKVLSTITNDMTYSEIISKLGKPEEDVGSGLYVFRWSSTDGRKYYISMSDTNPDSKPISAGFDANK